MSVAKEWEQATIKEYEAYIKGRKELEAEVTKLKHIISEIPRMANLSRWYNFDSISLTQMNLEAFIRSLMDSKDEI